MKLHHTASLLVVAFALLNCLSRATASDSRPSSYRVKALFKNPPRAYSTGPLWVWNDLLSEEEVRSTLRDLAAQDVKQVWVHPRPGLMTPYLGPEWFQMWKIALQEARRLDMNVWIYDENSYPSGFAGGLVPEAMPESRGRGLSFRGTDTAPRWSGNIVGVYLLENNAVENCTAKVRAGAALSPGKYLVAEEVRASNSPWYGDRSYVNLLSPGVTERFLELTLGAYRLEVGGEFGKRMPGVFSDEPNIRPAGEFPWSEVLAEEFQKRWGYNLLDHLPSLKEPVGDWRRVRHDYFEVLNEQFIEHWSKPYHAWCETNHLEWTGHYWDHEWPDCVGVPDNMAMYAWHQRPAIDCLMNQYAEHTHAQFGNVRMVKELSSIANQLGKPRTLCETYGAGGWDLRFEDMKRIADWLEVLGVNTINQHLSYVTIRGARKRDHPQSFSYHEPWWGAYHVSAQYLARLSAALSQGEQVNRVLVLEPTTTAWMYQGDPAKLKELGDSFFKLLMSLEAAQVEYDIGCEDVLARHGRVLSAAECPLVLGDGPVKIKAGTRPQLKVGLRSYGTIVIPAMTENLNGRTTALLEELVSQPNCGEVIALGEPPARVDGEPSQRIESLARQPWWVRVEPEAIAARLTSTPDTTGFALRRSPGDKGILFHHRRQLSDGELLFLANTSIEFASTGTIESILSGMEEWDLYDGSSQPYAFERERGGIKASFQLPPSGSLLLFLSKRAIAPASAAPTLVTMLAPKARPTRRPLGPNVLTLDYVDVTAGGETKTNIYCYQANQFAWRKNGMARDPWDSAVQFKNEIMARKFPPESGLEACYRFTIESVVPTNLALVLERPDLYQVTCNGKPVLAWPGDWWLDRSFYRIDLTAVARAGENVVKLKASPFTLFHELEPAYILGDFELRPTRQGFTIIAGTSTLEVTGGWNGHGYPFYSGGMAYRERFDLEKIEGRYFAALPSWRGSVAKVLVNRREAGFIDAPPWECEVTRLLRPGSNDLEVIVFGTLKNTLGPHHGEPPLGTAWPGSFHKAPEFGPPPGSDYSTVAYGLMEPFLLKQLSQEVRAGLKGVPRAAGAPKAAPGPQAKPSRAL